MDKILLDDEPSWPAVDALHRAVEQVSPNVQPPAVVAMLPSIMMTGAQTHVAIARQQPVATVKSLTKVPKAFGETLHALNDDVSIIKASPFPMATTLQSPKIGILHEVHLCGGLVMDFTGKEPISSDDNNEE
uniref:Uncharacterized protein n=1 Tax=Romanomermis culicivorax TaxID=13658 RepID=A0A915IP64_ROMCU